MDGRRCSKLCYERNNIKNAYLVSLEAGLHKIELVFENTLGNTETVELVFENTLGNTETVELDLTVIEGNKIVDKSKLYELLSKVSDLSKEDYTNETQAHMAQKVFENRDASQEEVNHRQRLRKRWGAEEKGLSTDVLEYAIDLAKSADTEGVIDSVKAAF